MIAVMTSNGTTIHEKALFNWSVTTVLMLLDTSVLSDCCKEV